MYGTDLQSTRVRAHESVQPQEDFSVDDREDVVVVGALS